ncbi:DUF1294 domain-containing protein [Veillonella montpellierensis]|uniref:DUF1294 domain-containing protein n=1 Tax=Veillonella montpellierensis TaxID=187328 RepID=UPI0023F95456|nr:DUF1294 domain-containing protein [Veillonella montpellierensis]
MKTIFDYIAIGICVWNCIVFIMYAIDKRLAITHMNRISEKTLLISAIVLGSIGAIMGMIVFCHKTNKWKFRIIVGVATLVQSFFGGYLFFLYGL